jgi:peptidoglycan hydrolase-like protein with peptidoglycan-binding domain
METLAYVHLSVAYEEPVSFKPAADNLKCFKATSWKKIPSSAWIRIGVLLISLSILSIASSALALQRGNSGSQVTNLQQDLTAAGFYDGPVTGFYGQLTQAAVTKFQQAKGLRVDGIAGSNTLSVLRGSSLASRFPPGTVLRRGSRGTTVTQLQNTLTSAGYYNGPITGYYGRLTEASVVRFQRGKGLRVDGIAGSKTLAALGSSGDDGGGKPQDTLRRGSSGQAVIQLQNRLTALGFYKGPITGSYGRLTEVAVRDFQRSRRLPVDGIVGVSTLSALQGIALNSSHSKAIAFHSLSEPIAPM